MSRDDRLRAHRLQLALRELERIDGTVTDGDIEATARWIGVAPELLKVAWVNIQNAENAPPEPFIQPF